VDQISENIIYLLSLNSRRTITDISKELKVERKIVETRLNNLYRKGFIKPLLISNEPKRVRFTILVKLNKLDEDLIQKIKGIKGLLKLKETLGAYDLSILFDVYSRAEAEETIAKISKLVHNCIITFDVLFHDFEDTLGYKSFCHKDSLYSYSTLKSGHQQLSDKEEQVLNILKNKPLITFKELSKISKIAFIRLKEIITKLKSEEIIRFSIDPDYSKLGLEFHNNFVKINLNQRKAFDDYILKHPRIHWVKHCSGRWDYVLSIGTRNINEFIDVIRQIRSDNKNIILEETSLVSKIQETRKY
jgi:DNA-binding Lrp family transcriptional regulator